MKNKLYWILGIIVIGLCFWYFFDKTNQLAKMALENDKMKIENERLNLLSNATSQQNLLDEFIKDIQPRIPIGFKIGTENC